MGTKSLGPITQAMYQGEEGQPPAIIREWMARLKSPGEVVCLWAGAIRLEHGHLGWGCMLNRSHSGKPRRKGTALRDISGSRVERLLAPLAHEGRIKIMQTLFDGALSSSALARATGFQGGGLYHHLKELEHASYVASDGGRYRLTNLGRELLVTVLCMASEVIEDRGEQGLGVGSHWQERRS